VESQDRSQTSGIRIFISYAHDDRDKAHCLVEALKDLQFQPYFDEDIRPGAAFTDEIRAMIARSHVFLPLLTEDSATRPWIHQEIGYAMALDIPVVPVVVGAKGRSSGWLSGEMIAQLHAVVIQDPNDRESLIAALRAVRIDNLLDAAPLTPRSMIEVADWPEVRTECMARYGELVAELAGSQPLRQKGALSSFCIPDVPPHDPIWKDREEPRVRSEYYHYLQRNERRSLERHAIGAGCTLIVYPAINLKHISARATVIRLRTFRDFLASACEESRTLRIVESKQALGTNLTIVGNYFFAESKAPRPGGYRQTLFNWHAPTVWRAVKAFDQEYEELVHRAETGGGAAHGPEAIIERIDAQIEKLASLPAGDHDEP
jgi:hypothetical protein